MDIAKKISDVLELPYDVSLNIPKIVLLGDKQAYIENYLALVEYKAETLKLKYSSGLIEISGSGFEINAIGEGNIIVSGKISAVKLI